MDPPGVAWVKLKIRFEVIGVPQGYHSGPNSKF